MKRIKIYGTDVLLLDYCMKICDVVDFFSSYERRNLRCPTHKKSATVNTQIINVERPEVKNYVHKQFLGDIHMLHFYSPQQAMKERKAKDLTRY